MFIIYFPANNYPFKVRKWSTGIRYENCSSEDTIKTSITLFRVFIVKCEHISHLLLIVDFGQANFAGFILKILTVLTARSGTSGVIML